MANQEVFAARVQGPGSLSDGAGSSAGSSSHRPGITSPVS